MTNSAKDLARLAEVSALIKERDLARLAAATATCQTTKAEIDQLSQDLSARAKQIELQERPDPAVLFGADERWRLFVLQQQKSLSDRLAREHAAQDAAFDLARRALGRADVLSKLAQGQRKPR